MGETVPVDGVMPSREMIGDDEEDTTLLQSMLNDAVQFLTSFPGSALFVILTTEPGWRRCCNLLLSY